MKRTALLIVFFVASFWASAQILGDAIVHWDFADGIPSDFVNEGLNDAIWEYRGPDTVPDNTVCSQGACGVGSDPIESLTADNGFVIFDSAWWDDNVGACSGSGGPVEGPHDANLITPSIDLSAYDNLTITFQQYFKHYQNTSQVSYSLDGGETWVLLHDNGGWYLFSELDAWVSININDWAPGQSDVRFKFSFVGDHYWWCLDDIAIFSPNDNDLQMLTANYSQFDFNQEPGGYGDIEYSIYPEIMTSPLNIKSRIRNIGGFEQTAVVFDASVTRDGVEVYAETDETETMATGAISTFSVPSWTPPGNGDYEIDYAISQFETDDNLEDNTASRSFAVKPYTYGRDEGYTDSQYLGIEMFADAEFEMGNMFESRAAGLEIHSIAVALGDSTTVGTTITGRIYNRLDTQDLLAETAPYTVNAWDLNSEGDSNFVWIPFTEPLITVDTTIYFGVIHHEGGLERARIAQSGTPPIETTFLRYPETNSVFYMTTTPMVRLGIFEAGQSPGCTDTDAENYNIDAGTDDGSCRYLGCTFEDAINYDATANLDDGTCLFNGCTDPEADNYDPEAVADDGSCEYWGCTNPDANNYDPEANVDDGTCQVPGCTDPEAVNYNEFATEDDGSCLFGGCTHPQADNYDPDADVDDGSCLFSGCTDPTADNYEPLANLDDGSCEYLGCTDGDADNYDPTANVDDGSCEFWGCTDAEADNYDPTANTDDGTCEYWGCTNVLADNYDPDANVDDGSCIIPGCTDPEADNYNAEANVEDGSCQYYGCTDPDANNYDPEANVNDGTCEYLGCTDPDALNYDLEANVEDGSCEYASAFFMVSDTVGCENLSVTVTNQTSTTAGGVCSLDFGNGTVLDTCEDSWETTYAAGEYTIVYTYTVSEVTTEYSVDIVVHPAALVPVVAFDTDTGVASCANCTGDVTIEWLLDDAPTGITDFDFNPATNGDYSIVLTDSNGCTATGEALTIIVIGISEEPALNMQVYPVPASTWLNVTLTGNEGVLTLYDLQGRQVAVQRVEGSAVRLDVAHLANGSYVLRWVFGDQLISRVVSIAR